MAPDAANKFSLFPRSDADMQAKQQHRRKTSSKSLSPVSSNASPIQATQETTAALSAIINDSFKPATSSPDRNLATVPEERLSDASPSPPPTKAVSFPPTHIGSTLKPPAVRRSRTPSPPRLQTHFSTSPSPPKSKKPALRTSQIAQPSYSLPLSPPPVEALPPLPAHVSPPRIPVPMATTSPATSMSPASAMGASPSSVKPPSSATTLSPTSPGDSSAPVGRVHRKQASSASTMASPQSTASPQFSFSPSLIVPTSRTVSYPSVPAAQSVATASTPRSRSKPASKEQLVNLPPPPPISPPRTVSKPSRPRRPSNPESNLSGTTALTATPVKPSKSLFPTYDPSMPFDAQARSYRPQYVDSPHSGYYAPSKPSKAGMLRHAPSSPDIGSTSSSRLTAAALQRHTSAFDAPPIPSGSNAITRANTAPRAATPAPPSTRAPSIAPPRLPYPRETMPAHDEALLSKSWGALTFVVGVGVEVAAGAVGGLKKGVLKERAKRELKKEKAEMKREREERKKERGRSRWTAADEDADYGGRVVEIAARVKDDQGVTEKKMDFRI